MSKLFTHSGPMVVGHMYRIGFMDILFYPALLKDK